MDQYCTKTLGVVPRAYFSWYSAFSSLRPMTLPFHELVASRLRPWGTAMICVVRLVVAAAADLEERERTGLAGGPLRLGRRDLHRLVAGLDDASSSPMNMAG